MSESSMARTKIAHLTKGRAELLRMLVRKQSEGPRQLKAQPRDANADARFPASGGQKRLWLLNQLVGGDTAYHVPLRIRLDGKLNVPALRAALNELVARHETLRTSFNDRGGEVLQVVASHGQFLLREEGHDTADPNHYETIVASCLQQELQTPFDLSAGPLVRGRLLRLADEQSVLLIVMHHSISDGWSINVLLRELGELYHAISAGTPHSLRPLLAQYADYVSWQQEWLSSKELSRHISYWKEHLNGVPERLELPTDRPRPTLQSYSGASVPVSLGEELSAQVRELSRRFSLSPAMTLLAAWGTVLSKLSGQTDIVIGMPVANRERPGVDAMIGFFVNTIAVRLQLSDDLEGAAYLRQVKEVMLSAYAHQEAPYDQIVEAVQPARSSGHTPIFQVMFSMLPAAAQELLQSSALTLRNEAVLPANAHFDLTLGLQETAHDITGYVNYATGLFQEATVRRWAGYLRNVLAQLVAAPDRRLGQLSLMDRAERMQVLDTFNATARHHPTTQLIHEVLEQQAALVPDRLAIVHESGSLTFAELNSNANQLARQLRAYGVRTDSRVALCFERGLEMVIGMFASLKAGGAYVPLDPVHPSERLSLMIKDCEPVAVLTHADLRDRLEIPSGCAVALLDAAQWSSAPWTALSSADLDARALGMNSRDLAYVIYTSGSTGTPKGVMVEHANVLHFVYGMEDYIHGLSPQCERIAWNSSFGFDMAAKAWGQLLHGRTVYLLTESDRLNADALLGFLERHRIEAIECTPSHLRMMQEGGLFRGRAGSLCKVLLGGEPIDATTWNQLAASTTTTFFNMYGPTECSVDATCDRIMGSSPNVGRVMPNARIYILDEDHQPMPVGVAGEIYIGGAGVARGYLKRPELTAERFVADPYSCIFNSRMYKTGDLGRWRADGTVEYLGRNDHQVKIRGFRIELGEIESQLARHERVKEAVVVAREDEPGTKRLVAYFVPRVLGEESSSPSAEALRAHLKVSLPDFMIPNAFVAIDRVPLTANGKLDRRALPTPPMEAFATRYYEAPEGAAEQLLADTWGALLGIERIGRRDNFFELGGHSLLIVQMMDRLRGAGFTTELRRVFESSSLAELAGHLTRSAGQQIEVPPNCIPTPCTSITPEMLPLMTLTQEQINRIAATVPGGAANIQDIYPLAPLQEGILFHHLLHAGGADTYVLSIVLSVANRERLDRLIAALQAVVDRHDILRTAIVWEHLPRAVQVVHRRAKLPVDEISLDLSRDEKVQIDDLIGPELQQLPLVKAPHARLLVASDHRSSGWYAVLQFHHITSDHVTLEILMAEVAAYLDEREPAANVSVPYRTHVARALVNVDASDHDSFFQAKLGSVDAPTAPFGLQEVHGSGERVADFSELLEPSLAQAIRNQARRLGVSAASILHAAWALVVARTSGRDDVVFGSVLLGRMQGNGEAQRTLGMFVNTLPLRLRLHGMSVQQLVDQTQRELAELLDHEQAPLATAQRCSGVAAGTPLFTTLFNYRHSIANEAGEWFSADGVKVLLGHERTNYPITLSIDDYGKGFSLKAQADVRIDPRKVTAYLRTAAQRLVEALSAEPATLALELSILPESERKFILRGLNATAVPYVRERTIHSMFEEMAACVPNAVAVIHGEESLTYAELEQQSERLAKHLRARGIGPGELVGICTERSVAMIVGLLAILKAGAAYLPVDPNYPLERVQFMIEDASPRLLLTQDRLQATLPAGTAEVLTLDAVDELPPPLAVSQARAATGTDLVYVIYTSGSTGRPKGTMMPHGAMVNLIDWHRRSFGDGTNKRVLQFAALSFDVAFQEVFSTLSTGATLVLLDEAVRRDARALMRLLCESGVQRLFVPPLMLQALAEQFTLTGKVPKNLEDVVTAGEQLRIGPEIRAMFNRMPGCRLHNHYGPTETHVVTALTLEGDAEQWPALPSIGRPIANTAIYVLDERRQPMPVGVPGEVYIGGANVARGYLGRGELTAQRFIDDPFQSSADERMYRTGDLGRWLEDGTIEYLGRNDDQVKLRGYRIELKEIELQLASHPSVREAAVIAREDSPGDKRLVAYVTLRGPVSVGMEQLRSHLKARLPEFMIPSAIVLIERLPVTPSGKVNYRELPAPDGYVTPTEEYEAPQGVTEETLAAIWSELLRLSRAGRRDNFFELGGHSLHAMKLVMRVEDRFDIKLSVATVFQHPTIAQVADIIRVKQLQSRTVVVDKALEIESGVL